LQELFQPGQPGEVQVVARLVQDEEVRAPHQRRARARTFSPRRHRLDGPLHDAGQAQALQQALHAARGVVAAHRFECIRAHW